MDDPPLSRNPTKVAVPREALPRRSLVLRGLDLKRVTRGPGGSAMAGTRTSGSRERRATFDLVEALGSSLDIRLVLERAYPFLLQLVPADYGALGISSSGKPEDYQWIVAKIPPAFFAAYPEMARHDFVRKSVARRPNVVMRDEDMVSRTELEANMMYRRAREVGAPLEQVMAVMLHIDDRWQSGLSLYREKERPFTNRERAILQDVTPAIVNAVRSCHLFASAVDWSVALEALLVDQTASIVLVAPPATEVARTAGAARLIDKWFGLHERRVGQLPAPLLTLLARGAPGAWSRRGGDRTLDVSLVPLTGCMGRVTAMLVLRELSRGIQIPAPWRVLLTPRQQEVTAAVLRGWDNRSIASELDLDETTVKRHLQDIFDRLGVQSRTALVARAAELQRG
jgi:DNA-binding CsgD family transcriptional regulator